MDASAKAIKGRVAQALKDARISLREAARRYEGDRDTVREWVKTGRTMPVEFLAWVALETGRSGHYLLTGERQTKAEGRYGLLELVVSGEMDEMIEAETDEKGDVKGGVGALPKRGKKARPKKPKLVRGKKDNGKNKD